MFRASNGSLRVDSGETSVITNPSAQQMIVLVHATMEAHVLPLPAGVMPQVASPALSVSGVPGVPGVPGVALPQVHPTNVLDLGTSFIEGHEVTGKQFTFAPPPPPNMPTLPGLPQAPQAPAIPGLPQLGLPQLLPPPTVIEAWTSTATQLPVLTTVTGPFGTQVCRCNTAPSPEPNPSMFQIPPGYRPAGSPLLEDFPQVPSAPQVPSVPQMPSAPQVPSLPQVASAPPVPSLPQGPPLPQAPSAPQVPTVPKVPGFPK